MKRSKGFSLIEVLAAFAILSIAILPIMSMYPTVLKMDRKSRGHEEGARLAFTIVDYIKSKGYANLMQTTITSTAIKNFITGKKYTDLVKTSGQSYYSSASFCDDFNIASNLFILNSKSLDLSKVNIWIGLHKSIAKLGDGSGNLKSPEVDLYATTRAGIGYIENKIIMGRVIVGWGDDDTAHLTGKEKEYSLQFIVTSLEK
ncbi:type IV pilus modification PilV family protein [Haliovirga abyssi]|uniref:Prepilin-type N-terminal cleavage/methylation domain-containing protein n=1 Tax=Haliovirga abyssi TaxID=2996794 RepID=A0AAU9DBG6_9FUSO|nr:prepilin-type N-terminal cleavage/methylation domain-containing protein [Haliovirga abyssi]BDU49577.1 hypothetical protein HLVA_01460 [Haliovirga abyssi]